MKCADTAMYRAKHGGRNRFRFFSAQTAGTGDRLGLIEERLITALSKQRFTLAWQPVVDLDKRETGSIEALLRWHDPDAGSIAPAEFIPLAEEAELFPAIGSWVLEQALLQNRRWQLSGRPHLQVAVNLSARQMRQKDIAARVQAVLQHTGHPAHLLELEIPETALLHDFVSMRKHLSELAAMGVRLSIDDFGTGELGLLALRSLPIQRLKLAARLLAFHEETRLIPAILGMAKGLGLDVVAKGVENAEQCATLHNLGCRYFQGHLFCQPLPADAEALLFFSSERIKI
jgi:EAL domain-containing protein (putative c-di-GMP-specific phosphodiesterase class I)